MKNFLLLLIPVLWSISAAAQTTGCNNQVISSSAWKCIDSNAISSGNNPQSLTLFHGSAVLAHDTVCTFADSDNASGTGNATIAVTDNDGSTFVKSPLTDGTFVNTGTPPRVVRAVNWFCAFNVAAKASGYQVTMTVTATGGGAFADSDFSVMLFRHTSGNPSPGFDTAFNGMTGFTVNGTCCPAIVIVGGQNFTPTFANELILGAGNQNNAPTQIDAPFTGLDGDGSNSLPMYYTAGTVSSTTVNLKWYTNHSGDFGTSGLFGLIPPAPPGPNAVYIASSAAGANNGTSCANAKALSYFNTAGSWSATPTGIQIGPDTTVHLCGTFTAGANADSYLQMQGSGTSGHPVTIWWEPGAIVQSPAFSNVHGGIDGNGKSFITLDGGTNGIVQNTRNGTSGASCPGGPCNTQQNSSLVRGFGDNFTVRNLSLINVYIHSNGDSKGGTTYPLYLRGVSNSHIGPNNTFTQADVGVLFLWDGGESNLVIDGNTFSGINQDIEMGTSNTGVTSFTNVTISNNVANNWVNWDEPGNGFHHNFFHPFTNVVGSSLVGTLLIYNNTMSGDVGQHSTSFIFIENNNGGSGGSMGAWYVFNNVFHKTNHVVTGGSGMFAPLSDNGFLLNNTFIDDDASGNSYLSFHSYGNGWTSKNNIYQRAGTFVWIEQTTFTATNDIYYLGVQGTPWRRVGTTYSTLAAWQAACGCDANSLTTDPKVNSDGTLQSGSSAIAAGVNLTSLGIAALNTDKAGSVRPSSGAWDIGALQFQSTAPDDTLSGPNPGWSFCALPGCDPGGTGVPVNPIQTINNSSPSLDGASMQFGMTSAAGGNTNALWVYKYAANDAANIFATDFWVYPAANCAVVQQFEYDTWQSSVTDNIEYMWGMQYNRTSGKWEIWNQLTPTWIPTAATSPLICASWNHIQQTFHRVIGDTNKCSGKPCMYFDTLTVNGVRNELYLAKPAGTKPPTWGSNVGIQWQLNIPGAGNSSTENLDSVVFSATTGTPVQTIYRPITFTDTGTSPVTNPTRAFDSDPATFAFGQSTNTAAYTIVYSGFPAALGTVGNATLYLLNDAYNVGASLGGTQAEYSLDGGSTWNQLWVGPTHGAQNSPVIDRAGLSPTQDFTQVQVRLGLNSSCAPSPCTISTQVEEVWIQTVDAKSQFSGTMSGTIN